MKKNCELCGGLARMHCESDQASLCWSCDFQVHAANFLVARHSRTLLCHVCQSPTPWTATGTRLGPTVSVCDNCLSRSNRLSGGEEAEGENETEVESENTDDEDVDEEEDDDDDEEEEIDDEDIQVVPWSPTTPPPPASSSTNSDEEESSSASSSLPSSQRDRKRIRRNASDLPLLVNRCCASSRVENVNKPAEAEVEAVAGGGGRVDFFDSLSTRSLKTRRLESGRIGLSGHNSWAIVESVKRFHRQEMESPAAIAEFCRLSEDPSAVDCDSSECSKP